MTQVSVSKTIAAPVPVVFRAISDVENLPATNPDIVGVEFLSAQRAGVGTRFRETRAMGSKQNVTELEITEYVENERVRMVADSHGTVWDTVFTVTPDSAAARLEIVMDARAHKLLPKLLNPIFKGLFRKGLAKHIDAVGAWCEAQTS